MNTPGSHYLELITPADMAAAKYSLAPVAAAGRVPEPGNAC